MLEYHSGTNLAELAAAAGKRISDLVLEDQAEQLEKSAECVFEEMRKNFLVMKAACEKGSEAGLVSSSGLSGGLALRMKEKARKNPLSGSFCAGAIARALAVSEYNAAMGRIVAAPTAGSCGILPAALLTMIEEKGVSERAAVLSLFTAGALGLVIAGEASLSGAEGGCQAECGSAGAMAAAALVELSGGSPSAVIHAAAIALKNQLGLVCDPVAGLVEVPCVKRNAGTVMCAIGAAEMALAGIESVIPFDEVVAAMAEIGAAMPQSLKETAQGGLAATPTGIALRQKLFG
ncbi:MAG: L-serine ammonia-lyase, iron-sulfur-dependent, subunit alpha [Spirochaetaceae bacterium]|jgi:L-serine dehydratase|nr:L-serine ammonia-lyase, iron-sulfur-dependent, subunit alpha [Spirochaetaceae bacterium]